MLRILGGARWTNPGNAPHGWLHPGRLNRSPVQKMLPTMVSGSAVDSKTCKFGCAGRFFFRL